VHQKNSICELLFFAPSSLSRLGENWLNYFCDAIFWLKVFCFSFIIFVTKHWRSQNKIFKPSRHGVHFSNVLRAAFTREVPESAQNSLVVSLFCTFVYFSGPWEIYLSYDSTWLSIASDYKQDKSYLTKLNLHPLPWPCRGQPPPVPF